MADITTFGIRRESAHEHQARLQIETQFSEQKKEKNRKRRERAKKRKLEELIPTSPPTLPTSAIGEQLEPLEFSSEPPPQKLPKKVPSSTNQVQEGSRNQRFLQLALQKQATTVGVKPNQTKTLPSNNAESTRKVSKKESKDSLGEASVTSKAVVVMPTANTVLTKIQEQLDWKSSGVHSLLLKGIDALGFTLPTPIQKATLLPCLSLQSVIAAAETGSGKTFAFGIPILHHILCDMEKDSHQQQQSSPKKGRKVGVGSSKSSKGSKSKSTERASSTRETTLLSCLIMTPTRELAMQISENLQKMAQFTNIRTIAIVGGIFETKQHRLLRRRPDVMVATPGRLNKLLKDSPEDYIRHSISRQLKYLVFDEADRLLEQHHFLDLNAIIDALNTDLQAVLEEAIPVGDINRDAENSKWGKKRKNKDAQQQDEEDSSLTRVFTSTMAEFSSLEDYGQAVKAKQALPKIRAILPHLAEKAAAEADAEMDGDGTGYHGSREDENRLTRVRLKLQHSTATGDFRPQQQQRRMVFITSATMTLSVQHKDGTKKILKWCNASQRKDGTVEAAYIDALISRLGMRTYQFKMIDINPTHKMAASMRVLKLECAAADKDVLLYYFCSTYPGRTLVFVNAISCLRRVISVLTLLQLPVWALHSQMPQRQRLKNLDRLKQNPRGIILATDVVGRGIDIPDIRYVVHYQFPKNTELYVHRSGRTARAQQEGLVVCLVTPADVPTYKKVCHSLGYSTGIPNMSTDAHVMRQLQARLTLAYEIDELERSRKRQHAEARWAERTATALDVDLGDEISSDSETGRGKLEQLDPHEAKLRRLRVKFLQRQLGEMLKQEVTGARGAYLHSGPNEARAIVAANVLRKYEVIAAATAGDRNSQKGKNQRHGEHQQKKKNIKKNGKRR